jgi:hypothetical protein
MKVKTTTITEQNVITFFVQKKFGIEFFFFEKSNSWKYLAHSDVCFLCDRPYPKIP